MPLTPPVGDNQSTREDDRMDRMMELAALEGWARNPAVAVEERLAAALQVIDGLNARIAELTGEDDD